MVSGNPQKTLMAIVAHPDDETFGMGGTLALYASRGVRVCLVCATRGEAGQALPGTQKNYASLSELREAELRCAAAALGVSTVQLLDCRDSGMEGWESSQHPQALIQVPTRQLAEQLAEIIRREKPQVVITHDPVGGYFHQDHISLHQAVNAAFEVVGDAAWKGSGQPAWQPDRLFYNTIARGVLRWLVRLMPVLGQDPRCWGENHDVDLTRIIAANIPIHARICYRAVADQRNAATRCHASQGGTRQDRGMAGLLRGWSRSHEVFMQGYPAPADGVVRSDLFEGV
jgi:LmbE family N-acetylglucosaminyl deacetylase